MCGIAGWVGAAPPDLMAPMLALLAHRGPDDSGTWIDGETALGMTRLAIIDLHTGRQPMTDGAGSLVIVFNGEIYNFRGLRAELEARGRRFRTRSDTEVILAAYAEYGEECVAYLRGMFSFAIWDRSQRTLFLARDRLGKKPLYYWHRGGVFLSGGVDSSALVASMREITSGRIATFSIGFGRTFASYDELPYARLVAERFATDHHDEVLEPKVAELLPAIVQHFDEPFADSSAVPTFMVAQATARHVKVALTGIGGDEAFGGYPRYLGVRVSERYARLPRALRRTVAAVAPR